ncbi:uncharacterized protein si:ch211-286b4.4 [Osmerus mordax]|uniref:uncharacterized protein si:ch211-286b4.4 n=1 Tax=Osmerus mordax TaxID=8014 RepID=UPI00350FD513
MFLTCGVSLEGCLSCPPGWYCAREGLSSPSGLCAAGFYCPYDFSSTTPYAVLCPKGHYCPAGSPLALACPTGEYQPNPGSELCVPCRPGFYCEEAVVGDPWPCPPHAFCPAGTMVPQPCPNGTFTPPGQGGLQEERECLSCPPGSYCRQGHTEEEEAGRIQAVCAEGYLCVSGSAEFTPRGLQADWSRCEWGEQCAGPCPPGDPVLHLCPVGHYCDGVVGMDHGGGAGPRPCPVHSYRPSPGAGSKGDCLPCPPGYYCNSTGLPDYSGLPCPPGHWCSGRGTPILCPGGTLRAQPGAADPRQCEPCPGGRYCPDPWTSGRPNLEGVACRAGYQCPPGAVSERLCKQGSYCGPQTADPIVCPEGFYCPEGSYTYNSVKQLCLFPYYCPANSSTLQVCEGGSMPLNTSGPRGSREHCCAMCEGGSYRPRQSPQPHCLPCPPGYHCPPGSERYHGNPCPLGYVCPPRSPSPLPCPPGSYGNQSSAGRLEDCHPCPPGTFNHLPAQRACFPCGSSSTSLPGSSSCTCMGENRAFQHSDGSCVCRTGFVFYDDLDFRSSSADSPQDCQPEVNRRCSGGQVRLAATRECVSPSFYSCNTTCGLQGGWLDVEMGICQCESYVSAEELCGLSCLSNLPKVSAHVSPDGQLLLGIRRREERVGTRKMAEVLGPDVHVHNIGNIHFVEFGSGGVFGWILTDTVLIDRFLSEPIEVFGAGSRQRRDSESRGERVLPRIPNPIVCLSSNDMIIFLITINHTDRESSHFPVYQKDHLFNSNPGWDYGPFRRLEILMRQTQFNSTRFAHVFSEPGKYVLLDNAVSEWSVVVVVSEEGTECDPRSSVFQPMTPALLVRHGVVKQHRLNLLPDWGIIVGVLSVVLVMVLVVTTTVLVLKPNRDRLVSQGRPKPRWRSLGEPCRPVEYVYSQESMDAPGQTSMLGNRGEGERAETEEPAVCRGDPGGMSGRVELEEFNVKTLYDKMEDQNLHLASQLARHRKDTQQFYKHMCQHTDALRDVLENMDPKKLSQFKELLDRDVMQGKACTNGKTEGSSSVQSAQADPSVFLLGALLRSVEALLYRLTGEAWQDQNQYQDRDQNLDPDQNQDQGQTLVGQAHCHSEGGECELQAGYTHPDYTQFFSGHLTQTGPGPGAPSHGSVHLQSTALCLSDQDLSKLVAVSPLSRTLQEIQHSLQNLTSAEPAISEQPSQEEQPSPGHLSPVALSNLSPQHCAVFLFGCQVVRLLSSSPTFPPVLLLLARSLPASSHDGVQLAQCSGDYYYDSSHQVLYLSEVTLQDVGQFISTILQAMAYLSSGSKPQSFMQNLHKAISAVSSQLFHSSFTSSASTQAEPRPSEETGRTLVEDFINVRVPTETQFTEHLLAARLQKYQYFKVEQLLKDLRKPFSTTNEKGPSLHTTPVERSCVEQEIHHLNQVFLQLNLQLHSHIQEDEAAGQPSLSRSGTVLLELKRQYISQRLDQLHSLLTRISQNQPDQADPDPQPRDHAHPAGPMEHPHTPVLPGHSLDQEGYSGTLSPQSPTQAGDSPALPLHSPSQGASQEVLGGLVAVGHDP